VPLTPEKCHNRINAPQQNLSFDHLIDGRLQHQRHGKAERLGSLQFDDELEFRRSKNREIGENSRRVSPILYLSRFSGDFPLLTPTDRAAPSYQLLVLSLASLPCGFFFFTDILNFGTWALLSSFLDTCNLLYPNNEMRRP
jgi:hypothetical protein